MGENNFHHHPNLNLRLIIGRLTIALQKIITLKSKNGDTKPYNLTTDRDI